ncbi:MAG: hypothetical protein ACJASU_002167 [Cognaticolwellia sp.]|jgi:hypothetical protein
MGSISTSALPLTLPPTLIRMDIKGGKHLMISFCPVGNQHQVEQKVLTTRLSLNH